MESAIIISRTLYCCWLPASSPSYKCGLPLSLFTPLPCSPSHCHVPFQLRHPLMPWDLEHLLQFQWSGKVVLTTPSGLELKGGLFKVRQVLRDGVRALQEGNDVVM